MNITITQDNSRIETLGSNGASIILKLYDLAIDSNNTLTLRGNISTAYAYGDLVDYLNTTYGPDLIVNATNRYISFADSAVLSALLVAGIGDGTGITEALAANADFGDTFKNNTDITSFNEFSHFTRANDNPANDMFSGCSSLSLINLSNATKISKGEFYNCSSLSSLGSFTLNKNVIIGNEAFCDARVQWGVLYSPAITQLKGGDLSTAPMSNNEYRYTGSYSSFGGTTFKQWYLPNLIETNWGGQYRNYYTCQSTFGTSAGRRHTVYGLLYFKNIERLYPGMFANADITSLVINNTTVPECCNRWNDSSADADGENGKNKIFVDSGAFYSNCIVYVPDSAVNDYKTASVWSTIASRIHPMSELTLYPTEADWISAGEPATGLITAYMS